MMDLISQTSRGPSTSHLDALLDRIRGGDQSAKEELINDAYPRALRLTRFVLRGDIGKAANGLTDDICSLAFDKFARVLKGGLDRDFASLSEMMGYLGPIIRHTAIDEVRRILGPKYQTQFPPTPLVVEPSAGTQVRLRFYEMVEDLPADERIVIELKYLYDYTNVDIAAILDIDRRDVAKRLIASLARLRGDYD